MSDASTTGPTINPSSVDRSVSDLLEIVWRHKWVVGGCLGVSLLLGALYLYVAEPTYEVAARVLVQPQDWPLRDGTPSRSDKEFLATQSQIINSPAVVQRAVASMEMPITINPDMDPVLAVLSCLRAKPITGTNVLSLEYQCKNSLEGIRTVEAILESYQHFLQEMNDDSRLESLRLLTRSEEKLRSELEAREESYRELRKNSPLIGQGKDATIFQTTILERLGRTLTEVRSRRIDIQSRMQLLRQTSDVGFGDVGPQQEVTTVAYNTSTQPQETEPASSTRTASKPVMLPTFDTSNKDVALNLIADANMIGAPNASTILQELYLAQVGQKKLAQVCGPKHPKMLALKEQISGLKDHLRSLSNQAPATFQNEIEAILAHENQLLELYEQELGKAKVNDDYHVKERQELDGIQRLKSIHNSLVVQLNDWRLADPKEDGAWGLDMEVLEAPTIGTGPIWPKKSVLLILCSAIGLLGGLGVVVVFGK